MPNARLFVEHKLTEDEAIKRLKDGIQGLLNEFGSKIKKSKYDWDGNCAKFFIQGPMMLKVRGTITVEPRRVFIDLDYPAIGIKYIGQAEVLAIGKLEEILRP